MPITTMKTLTTLMLTAMMIMMTTIIMTILIIANTAVMIMMTTMMTTLTIKMVMISNSNWTEWSTIQGVSGRVIPKPAQCEERGQFEIKSMINLH